MENTTKSSTMMIIFTQRKMESLCIPSAIPRLDLFPKYSKPKQEEQNERNEFRHSLGIVAVPVSIYFVNRFNFLYVF